MHEPQSPLSHGPAALSFLAATLSKSYRISISDGRIFIGTLACVDKQLNLVLINTEEFRMGQGLMGRYVGMVMIPWKWVVKAEAEIES
ncbi:hypothetical protein BOTBODRAFT_59532 [Botryobasidium botryosum FD-172 SS1]|uniref:Sm domain-containing protein n=1 Tax=Botryobasidium botryosum (strain FD-172 SS1) TaxID=930990 RepID=A0A067LXT4_BOTB1|nr:hypothetical protein BOTBODRAFT_59532 [Botryobasidium botryosum FD-172 SS1]